MALKEQGGADLRLSVVIPTLNSGTTLGLCLESLVNQDLARTAYEIIIVDAGSKDNTLAIAQEYGVDKIVPNPLKTGEAGKSAGIKVSAGEFVALIDSDNILPTRDWLERLLAPFADRAIVATEPIACTVRAQDAALTRYFSMLGMCDPICLFVKNYDRMCDISGRWTGLAVEEEDHESYLKVTLSEDKLPTFGANGFVFRRALLPHVTWEPYYFDIDVVHQLVVQGFSHMAKVKVGIVHLYCERLSDFIRKQKRRIYDFLYFSQAKQRTYPWRKQQKLGIIWFCLSCVLGFPLLWQMFKGYQRRPDRAWLYHLPVCWITLVIYALAVIRKSLGLKQAPLVRDNWQATTEA